MREKIYTIPINEAFQSTKGCPICTIYDDIEQKEVTRILGAAMMEPDVRINTNKNGFCSRHYDMMYKGKNRLSLALMLETHLEEIIQKKFKNTPSVSAKKSHLDDIMTSCYLCERINNFMDKIYQNLCWLYQNDMDFSIKLKVQPFFCLPHYDALLSASAHYMSKKNAPDFAKVLFTIQKPFLQELLGDIQWFCKKFDYRFRDEDWKNSKDAVERAIYILKGQKP